MDDVARVVGAGEVIEIGDRAYKVRPISIAELQEIQRLAVRAYKRQFLAAYAENMDLLPEAVRQQRLEAKISEVAGWDVADLPTKMAYDVSQVNITPKLESVLVEALGDLPQTDAGKRAVLATALDMEAVTPQAVLEMTGTRPRRSRIPYDSWWITATFDGIVTMVWSAVHSSHPDLEKDEVARWPMAKLSEVARLAEKLTTPALGNT
jgi:hypothetical protein